MRDISLHIKTIIHVGYDDDDDEFRFNDASTHEGHLHYNGSFWPKSVSKSHRMQSSKQYVDSHGTAQMCPRQLYTILRC